MSIHLEELFPGFIRCHFPNIKKMATTFVRFQEYYDDSMFHGRLLSFEDFYKEWCQRRGKWRVYLFTILVGIRHQR